MDKREALATLQLVVELTDIYTKQHYPQWNRRKRKVKEAERLAEVSGDAQMIKYADIIDNMDIVNTDTGFAPKFLAECSTLLQKMGKGNPELHKKATMMVNSSINFMKV